MTHATTMPATAPPESGMRASPSADTAVTFARAGGGDGLDASGDADGDGDGLGGGLGGGGWNGHSPSCSDILRLVVGSASSVQVSSPVGEPVTSLRGGGGWGTGRE
jgi:hypothetical protein